MDGQLELGDNFGGVELEPDLTYAEYPIRVLDQKDRVTRRRTIKFYKVQWNQHTEDEATWESEDYLEENFPDFFTSIQLQYLVYIVTCLVCQQNGKTPSLAFLNKVLKCQLDTFPFPLLSLKF